MHKKILGLSESAETPILSIITVTLNAERFLPALISDIAVQDNKNVEWVIVDGGSTDKTVEIIKSNAIYISNWISEPDAGFYDALNKAIRILKGKYYLVLGADDRIVKNCFEIIKNELHNTVLDEDLLIFNVLRSGRTLKPRKCNKILSALGWSFYISSHSVGTLIKTDIHKTIGLYSMKFPLLADGHFLSRICCGDYKIKYCNQILGTFTEGGMTTNNQMQIASETWLIQVSLGHNIYIQTLLFNMRIIKVLLKRFLARLLG